MEFNISMLTQDVRILSHKLGTLIILLKLYMRPGTNIVVDVPAEETNTSTVKGTIPQRILKHDRETAMASPSATNQDFVILKL